MNEKDDIQSRNTIKEIIRLRMKPNFAALDQEYECDYRTAKIRYYEKLNKEKASESIAKILDTLENILSHNLCRKLFSLIFTDRSVEFEKVNLFCSILYAPLKN